MIEDCRYMLLISLELVVKLALIALMILALPVIGVILGLLILRNWITLQSGGR